MPEGKPGEAGLAAGELMRRGHAKHGRAARKEQSPATQMRAQRCTQKGYPVSAAQPPTLEL